MFYPVSLRLHQNAKCTHHGRPLPHLSTGRILRDYDDCWLDQSVYPPVYCDILEESFNFCIERKGLKLYAYCIMSSHVHLIGSSEKRFSELLRDLKSYTAKRFIQEVEDSPNESRRDWLLHMFKFHAKYKASNEVYQVWQHNSKPIDLTSSSHWFDQKIQYIYDNPVKAGLVDAAEDYVRCSFYPLCPVKHSMPG